MDTYGSLTEQEKYLLAVIRGSRDPVQTMMAAAAAIVYVLERGKGDE